MVSKRSNHNLYLVDYHNRDMTICIATTCMIDKEREGIVFCADRLRSSYMHRFEGNAPKYKEIPNRGVLMGSGELDLIDEILQDEFLECCGNKEIEEMAKMISEKIKKLIQRKIEDKILSKHGLTTETYLERSKNISEILIRDIEEEKTDLIYKMELEFILAGCDFDGKIKLYTITQNDFYPHVTQNVAIIGSGTTISNLELSKEYQNFKIGLSEALLKIYKAKRSAERDFYVGYQTDMGVLFPVEESGRFIMKLTTFDEDLKKILNDELAKVHEQELRGMEEIKVKLNSIFYSPEKIEPEELSETRKLEFEFWNAFKKYLEDNNSPIRTRTTRPQHWYDTSIGTSQAHLSFTVNTQDGVIGCEIYIDKNKDLFNYLKANKEDTETKLHTKLDWMELPNKKASRIKLSTLIDITDRATWNNAFAWLLKWGEAFKKIFEEEIHGFNFVELDDSFESSDSEQLAVET